MPEQTWVKNHKKSSLMNTDIAEVLNQIKSLAKSSGGWLTEKRVERGSKVIIEISITFKIP
jgi:hypothetical protein